MVRRKSAINISAAPRKRLAWSMLEKEGIEMASNTADMASTTNNSTSVRPCGRTPKYLQ
jgi:hypothetical protein